MMLTIHGLPAVAKYKDVKTLLQRECNLNDFILDNLVTDNEGTDNDGSKKVRIGVANEMEGAHVIKCLNGFRCGGKVLSVIPIGKSGQGPPNAPQPFEPRGNFPRNDFSMQGNQYGRPDQMGPGSWNVGAGSGPNQWVPNQPQMGDFNYQQQNAPFQQQQHMQRPLNQRELMLQNSRGPMPEPFHGPPGGGPQNIIPQQQSRGALRNIETVDLPKPSLGRYQDYEQPKPVTIKKDNFIGSNQFAGNSNAPGPTYQSTPTSWQHTNPINKPGFGKPNQPYEDDKKYNELKPGILKNPMPDRGRDYKEPRFSPPRRSSPGRRSPGRNVSPGRRMPPSDHRMPHPDHKMPPNDQRMSRDGRLPDHRMGPEHRAPNDRMPIDHRGGDRMGPNDRRIPDDRMGPNDRRIPDDRMGPNDRRIPDDRMGPNDRRIPADRMGPNDRRIPDDRMGPNDRRIPDDRMGPNDRRIPADRMGPNDRRIPDDRMGPNDRRIPDDRMGPNDRRIPDDRMSLNDRRMADDRMGPSGRMPPNDRRMPVDDRMGPMDRRMPPVDRMGPSDHKMPPKDDRMGPNDNRMHDRRMSPGRRVSPSGRHVSPSGRRDAPMGRHISPPGRHMSPSGRRSSPPVRRISPSGRRMSPSGRRISPPGRRVSPPGRRVSPPGRRVSPPGRRVSPPGRRVSPSGRRISPGRRMSPSDKRRSPDRQMHPLGRRSPNRRMSPERQMRYSPGRPDPDKADRMKQVRPAYEPDAKAANQAMYSGGYRPNTHEPVQFAVVPGAERISPWQERNLSGDKYGPKKEEERNRMVSRLSDHGEKRISPRASRSPGRRDRSPIRDRYRRHSPSPRSPRRSWALEKRRSPDHDAPPPPAWPGQSQEEYPNPGRPMPERPERTKVKQPVWENSFVKVEERGPRDIGPPRREPSPHRFKQDDRFPREPKFERDFSDRRFPEPDRKTYPDREEFIARSERAHEEYKKKEDMMPKNQPPRTEVYRKKHEQIEEEFQDIYQRAVEFAKKTQELRKRDDHRKEPEHHTRDIDRDRRGHDGRDFFDRHDYRHEERPRSRHSDEYRKREPEWELDPRKKMDPNNLAKREKAVEEISRRIILKYITQVEPEIKNRVIDEIKDRLFNMLYDIYGDRDVSYIELIIKFHSKFDTRAEGKIFHEAALKFSDQYRGMKRPAPAGASEIPAKTARRTPEPEVTAVSKPVGNIISDWRPNPVEFASGMTVQQLYGAQQNLMNQFVPTVMPTLPDYAPIPVPAVEQVYQPIPTMDDDKDGLHLYLCKDNFQCIQFHEANDLKEFLISEIFNTTATSNWSPSFIFKGLQTPARYELVTQDPNSRDWLVSLDFSGFANFNVLVYTSEELWYERVAIWLPGHSKCRYIDPFKKLQLQNKKVEGVDIGKWKFVKSVVTVKGTRLYADVPPSAARVLETKKTLSYELQQVSVFLKAVAVDKIAFDAGLNEPSITEEKTILSAIQNSPMPTLKSELDIVKITVKGFKTLSVVDARKIKDMLVFEIFKYLRKDGQSSTDFIKYGLCLPNSFGVVPVNSQSKKWLMQLNMGNFNRKPIVIVGEEEHSIPLKAYIGSVRNNNMAYVFERLKQSNKGVKGLHFNLWKPLDLCSEVERLRLRLLIDMESVETLASLNFTLDYVDEHYDKKVRTVTFTSDDGQKKIMDLIREYKEEQSDSYEVANMDIESSDTDDDIVCLGEPTDDNTSIHSVDSN